MVNNMDYGLPKFSLLGYDDWKIMMEAHLYALHDCMWMVLEDGPLKIQMENPERNPAAPDVVQYIPKPKEKWDDRDCKKHNLDNVAKAAIFKTLDPITFSKIKHLKTAMEIWQGLGKLCEGSEDLRKQKIEVLLEKFKSFKMLLGESFDMLLRSLPTEWYTKATAIEEGRNLENYTVQGLLDELRTYEHELKKKKEEQVTPFPTALMTTPRVPSSEGTCTRNCDTPSSSQPSSSKMENYDEEFAMMVKKFRKFKKFFKKADSIRRPSKGKPQVEKYGERERNEKKKKAMVAAESDESSSSSSDEVALVCMEHRAEKSNHEDRWAMSEDDTLCLMAKDDADQEVTSQTSCSSSYESIPTSENLFDQFKKMMEDFEEINLKLSSLTEENKQLSEENLKLTEGRKSQLDEITQLKTENESLSEKVKSLNKELGILKSKEAVDRLLEMTKQKGREGLGFDPSSSKRKGRTTFIPPKPTAKPNKQKGKEKEKPTEVPKKHDHEVLDLSDKDEEVNEGDRMKPTEFIPFKSLPLKTSQRNPDSDSAEPSGNPGQPSNILDHSNGKNSGNGDPVPIHLETPTTSVLQPEAELDQPVNPNQHNLRWLRDHPPQQIIGDIQSGVRTRSAQQNLEAMLACFISQVVGAIVHFQKLEANCSSPAFYQSYLEMIAAQELSEFLQMKIRLKFEEEVLEFYRNGRVISVKSKKDPQRMIQVIKSTIGRTKVKLSQKKLGEKLHLPNSGVEIGRFPVKNLDWNIIGISGQAPSGPAKKADLNNDYKLVLELVIACLECGSGGHADDITQERAFIINALITKSKVNWAAHFFKSISKHLGKHNQKYLCQGLYIGHILESMGAASKGKKYEERYWLYYLSSKGENRAGSSATAEECSSDNFPLINLTKTAKRKHVVSPSPSVEAPQNLALVNLEEVEEVSDQGELHKKKKKRKITSPSTFGNVNSDKLKEKEPAEETSAHNRSPQQLEEEIHQVQSLPTSSPQPQIDDADNQFWQLYYDWRAWKVGNSTEQLLDWDQQLKNEKIIKKCLGIPVNHSCEQILDDHWVWQRNHEDLHLEYLADTPASEFDVDDEDPAVYKPVLSKTTEDQVVLTSEAQANLEATAEDFQIFPETSSAFETVLPEAAVSTPQKQNQEGSDEELHQHLQSQDLEILTTACEISNQPELEIPEKSGENLDQSTFPEATEAQEERANEVEERDSLSRDISNFILEEAEEESERTLRINDEEDVQDDAESLPMQLFQRTPSSHQVTNFHFHSPSIPTLPDEVLETWTKKVQGLIESALASQHASFRQEIEQMEARYNKLIEKSEETHCSNLKEISKSVDKTLEIISLLSNTVSNMMETYASDSYLQLKEVNKVREQIANVTVSLQKQLSLLQMDIRAALAVSSANQVVNKDYLKAVGTIAAHFSNDDQTEERRNNIRRIKELCGNMNGITEAAGSSKRKRN
ncbi:unnamed protein product [Cuscuta campestris]|uniref:Uncharacterized protein n=1 Tax=Cuscuta campestris TaxID=132261 RepID=A0A484KNJ9_9ASTE|nr:unnamed protein product [Cuscuta campestris]